MVGQNAVENNYLSDAQATQEQKELKQCTNIGCTAKVKTQWAAINAAQQASFTAGIVVGLPAGAIEPIKELVHMATNPGETYEALRGLFTSGNILGNVSDAVKESYISRLNKLEEEYQRAGASGSYNAGVETGKLLIDMAALATGAGGAAKAGIKVTEKAIAKVANAAKKEVIEAGKGAGKGANIFNEGSAVDANKIKENIASSQKVNESSNFKEHLSKEQLVQKSIILKQDVVDFRTSLPSKIKNSGNAASAEIDVEGISNKKLLAHSRVDEPDISKGIVGKGNNIFETKHVPNKQGVLIDRSGDSEAKIFEHVAKQLGNNTSAKGTVTIMTERPACTSCLGVADQFRAKYPNIKVNIIDNGGDLIKPLRKK
ncbi:hypothetical protein BGI30_06505 [Snodgrassella alvi]|nr:hypothetical protein BGI30_06505 [Snodgrassella alvi]